MYLHVGTGKIVRKKEIIGIFDLDKTTISPITKNFLSQSEKNGKVCSVNNDIPRSFVLTENGMIIPASQKEIPPADILSRWPTRLITRAAKQSAFGTRYCHKSKRDAGTRTRKINS